MTHAPTSPSSRVERCLRFALPLCALLCSAAALAAPVGQDVLAIMRAHAEAARLATISRPPPGVQDMQWNQLSPPGYKPGQTLQRLGVANLEDDDPRADAIRAEVQTEWQKAPAVDAVPLVPIRLTGFPVMLDDAPGAVKKFLLVPYYGACIHSPPPPANQAVLVTMDHELPRSMNLYPVWVTGKIAIRPASTRYGRAVYQITDAKWEAYPYLKYPLPQYRLAQ